MTDSLMKAVEEGKRGETREQELKRLINECGIRKQREFLEETESWTKELVEIEKRRPSLRHFSFEDAPSDVSGAVK